MAWQKISPAYI